MAGLSLPALAAEPMDPIPPANDEAVGFRALDENGDGFITRDEAKGTYLARPFDSLDTDRDGRLSRSEVGAGQFSRLPR